MRMFKKCFSIILSILLIMTALLSVLPLSVSAAGKNLITNSTKIDLLRPGSEGKTVNDLWTWENGVLTSLDANHEFCSVVFQVDGIDNTKTYRFSGKLKILEFGSDIGWYGPRMIFRGKNRDDIENCDYSALCHFQNTEVFINNFFNATTLPYEVSNARAKVNTEMEFDIYVSPERTVVYYAGKKRFDVENGTRAKKIPYAFGFWTIGCRTQFYDLSLVEAEMPTESTTGGTGTSTNGSSNATVSKTGNGGGNTATTTTTTQPVGGDTTTVSPAENGESVDGTTDATEEADASTTTQTEGEDTDATDPTKATVAADGDANSDGGTPWLIPVIIVAVVLLAAIGILYYLLVIRKK